MLLGLDLCVEAAEQAAFHPVYKGYFADPFVWQHAGTYYAVGTGGAEADGVVESGGKVIPLLRSDDLRHWEPLGHALVRPESALGGEFWAPAVAEGDDGLFYLYYSVGQCPAPHKSHQLRVSVSTRPEGPYQDAGAPLLLPGAENFVFDPHPFRDDAGQWLLFYNRNYLDVDESGRAGDAIMVRRLETMTQVGAEAVSVLRPTFDWQRGPERVQNGQAIDWHTCEGPCVVSRAGQYWCFYSGSAWFTKRYGVDFAVSSHACGPYGSTAADAPRVLRAGLGGLRGPGHNSIVVGPDGTTDFIVFHAWDAAMQKRQMYIEPLTWTPDGPHLVSPHWL